MAEDCFVYMFFCYFGDGRNWFSSVSAPTWYKIHVSDMNKNLGMFADKLESWKQWDFWNPVIAVLFQHFKMVWSKYSSSANFQIFFKQ